MPALSWCWRCTANQIETPSALSVPVQGECNGQNTQGIQSRWAACTLERNRADRGTSVLWGQWGSSPSKGVQEAPLGRWYLDRDLKEVWE